GSALTVCLLAAAIMGGAAIYAVATRPGSSNPQITSVAAPTILPTIATPTPEAEPKAPNPPSPAPLEPQSAEGLNARGEAALRNKNFDHAIADFSAAIRIDPK